MPNLAHRPLLGAAMAVLVALSPLSLLAHPLPGTTIHIVAGETTVDLTITVPREVLQLALPAMAELGENPAEGPLALGLSDTLARYLAAHLSLDPVSPQPMTLRLTGARNVGANHEDRGRYDVIVIDLTAPRVADALIFPLALSYDAVLHEVRNHRARVTLKRDGQAAVDVGEISFDLSLRKAEPLILGATR